VTGIGSWEERIAADLGGQLVGSDVGQGGAERGILCPHVAWPG